MPSQYNEEKVLKDFFKQKKNGFLVDVGAANGIQNSNTRMLLNTFGWHGILIEPHPRQHARCSELYSEDENIIVLRSAVWSEPCTKQFFQFGQGSTLYVEREKNYRKNYPNIVKKDPDIGLIDVECDTLTNLLKKNNAPEHIDFLSVDAEGADLIVLQSIDFSKYSFGLICVENPMYLRKDIKLLMEKHGYILHSENRGNRFFKKSS